MSCQFDNLKYLPNYQIITRVYRGSYVILSHTICIQNRRFQENSNAKIPQQNFSVVIGDYLYFLSLPTLQRYKNNADKKRSCDKFFFRQHILCCQCSNKFSPFWVYNQWSKLNLEINRLYIF